ncbi:outer membrane beta-barrel protein [Flavobacterium wongokense]|uniref:outer membrane beta-barrel protein n=1 Tax=Flavobacterium wongokense TaxID=2910674 RepID=UPI001F15BF59|nr:outer membrane beta-barrel protein [Flavobacterium sp. WG47]MCF6130879.1 outer membrane beta-barrel protein [Flavobacterium sp. WG47]
MPKSLLITCLLLVSTFAFSQKSISLKGKVVDETTKLPIESATVYLSAVKDSAVVDYTITNKLGNFEFKIKKINQAVFLKVSFVSYRESKIALESITEDRDFGTIALKEVVNKLDEVVIKNETPPIRIKKDTLEFNASSFKLRPDANVETLLKQLPGVEIDADGKITVNGKEVNQILVNGKPFFDKDGKIALQNLPSDIINKVQVTDTKTKKEEITGQAASSNNASINLTIDEDKNKGLFGKFMAGGGTDKRYESSALVNYFKGKRKISALASSNNINSTGFSMDEIFDNMSGSRNNSFYTSSDGSFGLNGMTFGGNKGITHSNLVGINYSDEFAKDFDATASYFFAGADSNNKRKTNQINFLPDGNFTTNSNSDSKEDKYSHNLNMELEYKIDSTFSFVMSPKFAKSNNKSTTSSFEESLDDANQLLNESSSFVTNDYDKLSFSNTIDFNKAFRRKGRNISGSVQNENIRSQQDNLTNSSTIFYQGTDPDDIRNQIKNTRTTGDKYSFGVQYTEPVIDSLSVFVSLDVEQEKKLDKRKAFDFDSVLGTYTLENDVLSNYMTSTRNTIWAKSGIQISKSKLNLYITGGQAITKFDNHSLYLGNTIDLNKKYILPVFDVWGGYNFTKTKGIWVNYNYEVDYPEANQVLPVENLANPLNTYKGNAELNPNKYHRFYFSFRDFDYATRSGYSIYTGGSYYDNQIVSSTTYDANRKRTTTFENISGTYESWLGFNWNKTIKKGVHSFKFGFGANTGYDLSKGYTNGKIYEANVFDITPRVNFTYDYGELFSINPTYRYTLNDTKYSNYVVGSASSFIHRFNMQVTNYWPKNWVFGNDFGYTYNSNIADGFKKDFYLWNTSLAYSFYNKKFTAKVKIYDLLNQNQNATRTITPTSIRDEENIVLKRYAMFSLTYKIEKFAGKEKKSEGSRFHW